MKRFFSLCLLFICFFPVFASAQDFAITSEMQSCTVDADCGLISNSCQQNCGFVPVNKAAISPLSKAYEITCRTAMTPTKICGASPLTARCINSLCSVSTPSAPAAQPAPLTQPSAPKAPTDPTAPSVSTYQSGAYNNAQPASPNQVQGDYSQVNDRKGDFSAYNLPKNEVKDGTVGQIINKIYVPSGAPVFGEQYTVIETKEVAPVVPAPVQPAVKAPVPPKAPTPQAVEPPKPSAKTATPVVEVPNAANIQPAKLPESTTSPQPSPAPIADVPHMTPSRPYQKNPDAVQVPKDEQRQEAPATTDGEEEHIPSLPDGTKPVKGSDDPVSIAPQAGGEPSRTRDDSGPYSMSDLPQNSDASTQKKGATSAAPSVFTIKTGKALND